MDTLASVARQELDFELEHVCVDGGSSDGDFRAIIDGYARMSPRVVRVYEPDRGIFDAMNKAAARGARRVPPVFERR